MIYINMLFGLPGGSEMLLIAFVVLLMFGGKKLPELMKGLGKGIREFNNAKANIESEVKESMKEIDDKEMRSNKQFLYLKKIQKQRNTPFSISNLHAHRLS